MIAVAIELAASFGAVLVLAAAAHGLKLGGDVRIRGEEQARILARQAIFGFAAVDVGIDRAGIGALLRDASGRVMLLRRHGVHFAARLLERHDGIRLDRQFLTIGTGERAFGTVTLDLGDQAQVWAGSLRRLGA